ncbi:MAG: diaminopimelate decarboxylase, partial [Thermoflavifilum sp.]|nr:diaminopimelate decarboxylase [Thermoflavifilum sp.]
MPRSAHADVLPGEKLLDIAHQFGTPVYVYHAEKIQKQYEKMKKAFQKAPVQIYYACKALTNINILKFMRQLGTGLDTVSIQ